MPTDEDISCSVEDGEVKCHIEDVGEVEMIDEHREVVEEQFGDVASLESCARVNEYYLQENDFDSSEITRTQRMAGELMIRGGCPIPDMTSQDPIE